MFPGHNVGVKSYKTKQTNKKKIEKKIEKKNWKKKFEKEILLFLKC